MSFKSSLPQQVLDALTGSMLGDGWIGFNNSRRDPNPTGNACYAMTLKNHEYIMYLWSKIYSPICTSTVPRPWPNPKTGLPASQYTFQTRSLVPLTLLHKIWYSWSPELTKYVKILPLNILPLTLHLSVRRVRGSWWVVDSNRISSLNSGRRL
jgi:hypothetical protein